MGGARTPGGVNSSSGKRHSGGGSFRNRTLITAKNSDEITTFYTSVFSPDSMITRSKLKQPDSNIQAIQISPIKLKGRHGSGSPLRNQNALQLLTRQRNSGGVGGGGNLAHVVSSDLLSPNGTTPLDISVECKTRKSFSDLDIPCYGGVGGASGDGKVCVCDFVCTGVAVRHACCSSA